MNFYYKFIIQGDILKLSVLDENELDKKNIKLPDMKFVKKNLSSGLNHLDIPPFFLEFAKEEIEYQNYIKDYSECEGNRLLVECVKLYEKQVSNIPTQITDNEYGERLCITSGASSAIVYLIEYLALNCKEHEFIFIGYNYFLFFQIMKKYSLKYSIITADNDKNNRIIANTNEIIKELQKTKKPKVIFITMPFNPSGENYTSEEISLLIEALKADKRNLLIIDKCQQDELHEESYVNIGNIVAKKQCVNQTIVINSYSKVRSLPGIRIGYILGNKSVIDYVTLKSKYSYYNHVQIYIFPIIADLILRSLYISNRYNKNNNEIMKQYKLKIAQHSGLQLYTQHLRGIINKVFDQYNEYSNEIICNYNIIKNNYEYCIDILKEHIIGHTSLKGGINFCIKFKNMQSRNQLKHCEKIIKDTGLLLMPECYFNGAIIEESEDPFWFRITLAFPESDFKLMINTLKTYFDSN